jgi:hypothetical protein
MWKRNARAARVWCEDLEETREREKRKEKRQTRDKRQSLLV